MYVSGTRELEICYGCENNNPRLYWYQNWRSGKKNNVY